MPKVEVLKPFNRHAHGDMVHPPEVIEVGDTRAAELKRLGLARDPVPAAEVKAAPVPDNKMAPAVENKAAPAPAARPRGRPPGRKVVQ